MTPEDLQILSGGRMKFRRVTPDPALPGNIVPCLLCGKPFLMPFFIGEPDQVCGECMKTYQDTAKVVCVRCRVTICRIVPKLLDSGYYIRPHSILHSDQCGVCNPNIKESTILEIAEWERKAGRGRIIVPMS